MNQRLNRKISIAPMMGYTDRHFRYLMRLISKDVLLYTEMYIVHEILRNKRCLAFDACENPVAVQLGGSDPILLARCAKIAEDFGFDEVNLNVGCPSSRVQQGKIGACLMKEPNLVAECISEMRNTALIPVTVKCRLGVDEYDSYEYLAKFIEVVSEAPCQVFILHARKALLKGLNPKQNREVPPLQYDWVYQIKKDFPHLEIILNGGIKTPQEIDQHLHSVDGVMLGRVAYQNPFLLAEVDRVEVVRQFLPYFEKHLAAGTKFSQISRHLLNLFHGWPFAREWRRVISSATEKMKGVEIVEQALAAMLAKANV